MENDNDYTHITQMADDNEMFYMENVRMGYGD